MEAARGARLALCYLCARLGERLAQGSLDDLAEFDLMAMKDADFFQLKSYLQRPALARLLDYLHAPDLLVSLAQMQESMKTQK
jgi:hypothetical protein